MDQEPITNKTDTGGGAAIGNDVKTEGGDFVGRDKTIITKSDGLYIVAILALVVIAAIYFSPRENSTATAAETSRKKLDPIFTSQPTNTPAVSTKTPNVMPTDTAMPTTTMTARPEPESTAVTQEVVIPTPTATPEPVAFVVEILDAIAQVEINFCEDDLVYDNEFIRKKILLMMAKSDAEKKLFGSHLTSTTVDNRTAISTTIMENSAGWVRVFGTPRYYDGEELDEYCVSFVAYVTEEDRAR